MSDAKGISILGICGSLRKGSYNMAALQTAIELKPPGMTVEVARNLIRELMVNLAGWAQQIAKKA
jgi:NAD(P)H-dependent FMN reductase